MSKPLRKVALIVFVMLCSYATLLTIIHVSRIMAETESEATTHPSAAPAP